MTRASHIVTELDRLYRASVERLQAALNAYLIDGTTPDPASRADGSFAYPEIHLRYRGGADDRPTPLRSFGRPVAPGQYRTRPDERRVGKEGVGSCGARWARDT